MTARIDRSKIPRGYRDYLAMMKDMAELSTRAVTASSLITSIVSSPKTAEPRS